VLLSGVLFVDGGFSFVFQKFLILAVFLFNSLSCISLAKRTAKPRWGQFYQTLYFRNLLLARVFVPVKPFQPNLMFTSKAGAYKSETLLRCSTLG
jgi:hypothetical protein